GRGQGDLARRATDDGGLRRHLAGMGRPERPRLGPRPRLLPRLRGGSERASGHRRRRPLHAADRRRALPLLRPYPDDLAAGAPAPRDRPARGFLDPHVSLALRRPRPPGVVDLALLARPGLRRPPLRDPPRLTPRRDHVLPRADCAAVDG